MSAYEDNLEIEIGERENNQNKVSDLRKRAEDSNEEIRKAINVGEFLLSNEAVDRLKKYQTESENASQEETWFDFLQADWEATENCLKDLMIIAKRDLAESSFKAHKKVVSKLQTYYKQIFIYFKLKT